MSPGTIEYGETSDCSLGPTPDVDPGLPIPAEHVRRALDAVVAGVLSAEDVQWWANLLVMCDNFDLLRPGTAGEHSDFVSILHELATPEIFGVIDIAHLLELRRRLDTE